MHVLMLGWEFPPFITGGLGTACFGLTRALDEHGVRITFVLPKSAGDDQPSHVQMITPQPPAAPATGSADASSPAPQSSTGTPVPPSRSTDAAPAAPNVTPADDESTQQFPFQHMQILAVHSGFLHPYDPEHPDQPVGQASSTDARQSSSTPASTGQSQQAAAGSAPTSTPAAAGDATSSSSSTSPSAQPPQPKPAPITDYAGDVMEMCERYATFCVAAITQRKIDFDVIHAHDWMTYPAGLALARLTGKPLVAHIHSTEFDRSGESVNQRIYDIERRGMHGAMRVVAVSQLTKNLVVRRYAVPESRVEVVYNGVMFEPTQSSMTGIRGDEKIVLYFGRITYQKGPEYFVRAAKRVLEVMDNVRFVVAGSGDLARHMMQMADELGIGDRVIFTGFLRGKDIPRAFSMADLYVMPSISEPFGIAPLEAMSHDVPALISKSSGVSEVLSHALKVDFWDVDDMANKIVAVLRHPPLSSTLRQHGAMEVRTLTWDGAAQRCEQVYQNVIDEMRRPPQRIDTSALMAKRSTVSR